GRSTGLGRGRRGIDVARASHGGDAALWPGLHLPRRRLAGEPDRRITAAAERYALSPAAPERARSRFLAGSRRPAAERRAAIDPGRPRRAWRCGMAAP